MTRLTRLDLIVSLGGRSHQEQKVDTVLGEVSTMGQRCENEAHQRTARDEQKLRQLSWEAGNLENF